MRATRDHLVLGLAFVAAVSLHAALLPWVGAAVGREATQPLGDLVVEGFDAPAWCEAGDALELSVLLRYEPAPGMAVQLPRRVDALLLSRDRLPDEQDATLAKRPHTAVVGIARTDALALRAELPADADGPYWLIVQADAEQQVPDRDRANNALAKPIFIDGPQTPELAIERFTAPDQAAPGGSILVDFEVKNTGDGWAANPDAIGPSAAQRHWTDRVYLSTDDRLDPTDLPLRGFDRTAALKPGDAYRHHRVELDLPRNLTGPMHLILVTDDGQVLDQPSFTAGLAVQPIELVETGAPDLVVATITRPDRLVINRPAPVGFSIANLGSTATEGNGWVDGLYLAPQPVLDERAIPLGQTTAGSALASRGRYATTTDITLPESVEPGAWYLIVMADAGEAVDEKGFDDNNAMAVPITVLTEAQADEEIALGKPDAPEQLVVQWIEYDRVEEHLARLSRTVQPAIQDRADPVPDAPLIFDPQPPAIAQNPSAATGDPQNPNRNPDPTQQQDTRPTPAAPDATQTDVAPRPQSPGSLNPPRIDGLPGDNGNVNPLQPGIDQPTPPTDPREIDPTPSDNNNPSNEPGDRRVDSPAEPDAPDTDRNTDSKTPAEREADTDSNNPDDNRSKDPSEQTRPNESDKTTDNPDADDPSDNNGKGQDEQRTTDQSTTNKPSEDTTQKPDGKEGAPAAPSQPQTPTRAPRDPSEAPPVNTQKIEVALQEGKVLVGKGVKVTTKLPTPPGTGTRALSIPRNARVRVTFTADGKVYDARMLRSTGEPAWDAAIEASLFRWTAEGEAIKNAKPYVEIEWDYLLNDLLEDDK